MGKKLKGKYRFYLDYATTKAKRKGTRKEPGKHTGNVIALVLDDKGGLIFSFTNMGGVVDCVSPVTSEPNSIVCADTIRMQYLHDNCKLISAKQAEEIHPKLFEYLRLTEETITK